MTFTDETLSVVVGGGTGIGHAVAELLSQRPGRVEVAGRKQGLDIADAVAVESYFARLGAVDHVVVTAGSSAPGGRLLDIDPQSARAAFDVKFWGSLAVARAAAKVMRPGGTITFTSGFLARRTVPGDRVINK